MTNCTSEARRSSHVTAATLGPDTIVPAQSAAVNRAVRDWRQSLDHTNLRNECWGFCAGILPAVSRSFAIIIPQCPEPLDRAMCVAYLICRLADTVEDEVSLTDAERALLYDALLASVDAPADAALAEAFIRSWSRIPEGDYGRLVEGTRHVIEAYATLPDALAGPIRTCVHEMIAGMRSMGVVERRAGIAFICRDMDDLERYCHFVAGTVGMMSTRLFEIHLEPVGFVATGQWREDGRRLGLALQMTNIIKDCRVDADRKVSFIPAAFIDFSDPPYRVKPASRVELMTRCIGHLDAGLSYSLAVPASETGIRTFLLGSLLPAIATLEVAAPGVELHPKIDRVKMAEIFEVLTSSVGNDQALRSWYSSHRRRTLSALGA